LEQLCLPPGRLVLGLVGGGQDGARLANAFTEARFPPDTNAVLLTGPYMPPLVREQLAQRAQQNPQVRLLDFVQEPVLLVQHADRVVSMGGYGTTCEILSFEKHALIVPRVKPRLEQMIRAQRLADLGLVEVVHPDEATPARLGGWLARDLGAAPPVRSLLNLDGLRRVPELALDLIESGSRPAAAPSAAERMSHAPA
jgi:predicted glycosyltransferase